MSLVFHWIFDWLLGWGGLSIVVAACAGAVWSFVPPVALKIRALAFNVAIGALAFNSVYTMGYQHGASTTKTEWEAAEQRTIKQGTSAHEQAEQDIPPVVELAPPAEFSCPAAPGSVAPLPRKPAPIPRWMSDDRHNRDNH